MAYIFQDLLRIREMRENMAQDDLIKAKNKYEEAVKKVEQKKQELKDYIKWREEEEKRLYDEIINKKIKRGDINDLKYEIAKMKNKQANHEKAVEDARAQREQAKEDVEKARILYNEAIINREKIDEHKTAWMADFKKEKEMIADKELEEFRLKEHEELLGEDYEHDEAI